MTKEIRCRRCSKVVEVPDDYDYKTCSICREKDKADRRVKSEIKKSEKKLVKDLKIDKLRMPEMLWSYKNYCDALGQYWHTKPSYEKYQEKVKEWVKQQIELEADYKIAEEKRRREILNDPWEREGFLRQDRDKMDEALARRERNMKTIDPELVREIMETPEHSKPESEPLTETGRRANEFFEHELGKPEPKRTWQQDLDEQIAKINKNMKNKKEDKNSEK